MRAERSATTSAARCLNSKKSTVHGSLLQQRPLSSVWSFAANSGSNGATLTRRLVTPSPTARTGEPFAPFAPFRKAAERTPTPALPIGLVARSRYSSLSRRHAVIQHGNDGSLWLYDISTRGTRLNRRRVESETFQQLRPGDILHFAERVHIACNVHIVYRVSV